MVGATKTILVVDDDGDFLAITSHVLEAAGYRVVCSSEPEKVPAILGDRPCDLVITDLMMSCLDSGFSLARQIKQDTRTRDLPVIIATSARSSAGLDFRPRSRTDLEQMFADAYLDKPVPKDVLLKTIDDLLNPCSKTHGGSTP